MVDGDGEGGCLCAEGGYGVCEGCRRGGGWVEYVGGG